MMGLWFHDHCEHSTLCSLLQRCTAVRRLWRSCWRGRPPSLPLAGSTAVESARLSPSGTHFMHVPTPPPQMWLHTRRRRQLRGHSSGGRRQERTRLRGQEARPQAPGPNHGMLLQRHQHGAHADLVKHILLHPQASPTAADALGAQPVHQVAVTGQEEALRYLVLDLKVDVNQRTPDKRLTALHYAAKVSWQSVRRGEAALVDGLFFNSIVKEFFSASCSK